MYLAASISRGNSPLSTILALTVPADRSWFPGYAPTSTSEDVIVGESETALRCSEIAAQRKAQCSADFLHAHGTQPGHALPQSLLRDRDRIVQVHRAGRLHTIVLAQDNLGR